MAGPADVGPVALSEVTSSGAALTAQSQEKGAPKSSLHVAKQTLTKLRATAANPQYYWRISRGGDAAPRRSVCAERRPYHYAGNTVESVISLSMVCSETFSTVAPTFDPSRSTIQTCWPCSKGPRAITLSSTPSSVAGLSSTSTQIASVSPKSVIKVMSSSTFGLCM